MEFKHKNTTLGFLTHTISRAGEPANFLAAPAPFPDFFPSGSGSGSKEPKTPGSDRLRLPSPDYKFQIQVDLFFYKFGLNILTREGFLHVNYVFELSKTWPILWGKKYRFKERVFYEDSYLLTQDIPSNHYWSCASWPIERLMFCFHSFDSFMKETFLLTPRPLYFNSFSYK